MRFYDNLLKNIDIAILEGIVTFGNNEGRFCREISRYYDGFKKTEDTLEKNKIINEYRDDFETFAKIFKVIRTIKSGVSNRNKLLMLPHNVQQ